MTAPPRTLRSFRLVCRPGAPQEAEAIQELLEAEGFRFAPEPFHPLCRRLVHEPRPLGDSLAAAFGLIYIQDRSSMLPPLLLDPAPGARVLDMCAAPGSKTGFLAQLVGPEGFVLGNEPSRDRLATLRANLARLNLARAATCSRSGEQLPLAPGSQDCIQLDPPCSGWGTVAKNPKVMDIWHAGNVGQLEDLQRRLLAHAAELLAPGGRLLYSTCTTNPAENEHQARWAAAELGLTLEPLTPPPGFSFAETPLPGSLTVDAAGSEAQGFFLALLRKPAGTGVPESAEPGQPPALPGQPLDADLLADQAVQAGLHLDFSLLGPGQVYAFGPQAIFVAEPALELPATLPWRGFPLGRLAGKSPKDLKFRPAPRCRALLPAQPAPGDVVLEQPEELAGLLAGRSLERDGKGGGLYWRGVPLGFVRRQGRRILLAAG